MEIENLLDELEDILDASWRVPMSGGRTVVNANEIKRIVEDIRLILPKEIIQAQKIVDDRAKIIEDAKNEAETIIRITEEKIKIMVSQSEIVKSAQATANNIVSESKIQAKEIRSAASEYVEEMMKRLDQAMTANLAEIRKARQNLHSPNFSNEN